MNIWLAAAGAQGVLAVAAGAFGSHALQARLSPEALHTFEIGADYHLPHAVALAVAAALIAIRPAPALTAAAWLFFIGATLFSGSLYLLATTGARPLAFVTPVGGVMLIGGWAALCIAGLNWRP